MNWAIECGNYLNILNFCDVKKKMFPCILIKEISIFRNKVLKGNFVVSFKNFYEYNIEVQIFIIVVKTLVHP